MNPAKKRRLLTITFVLFAMSGAVSLLLIGLGSNLNHYYELSAIQSGEVPTGKAMRIGGIVQKNSIQRTKGSLKVNFVITDLSRTILVKYDGILPDLFREGQGVLVKGKLLDKQTFIGDEILAKHDENYMPKEVQQELEKNGYYPNLSDNAEESLK